MKKLINVTLLFIISINVSFAMGLRSFVALPINTNGGVVRFLNDYNFGNDVDVFITAGAYGISPSQALFFALPTRLSPSGSNRLGDFSALYRHTLWQQDSQFGTARFAFLSGLLIPTYKQRDVAAQAGFVFTRFYKRHEIDVDALYQKGIDSRPNSGRYDISWQYRLSPKTLPEWGIADEIYTVLELNGRWQQGQNTSQQLTAGLTWATAKFVLEGGFVKELNHNRDNHLIISTRFHF